MRKPRAFLPGLLMIAGAIGGVEVRAAIGDRILGADGTVHRVESKLWPPEQGPGTAIQYTRQSPSGQLTTTLIPGTDDYWLDGEPTLALDPVTKNPVAVWTRLAPAGFDLYVASLHEDGWTAARPLLQPNPDRIRPRIKSDGSLLHVFWTHRQGSTHRIARASFRAGDLRLLLGPEPARLDCVPYAGASTVAPAVGDPPAGDTYFAAEVPGGEEGEPPLLGVWGVRDEPVPIDFRASFLLPEGARELRRVDAAIIAGRLAVWFEWSGGLWYTFDDGAGNFLPLRVIKREAGGFSSEALVLLREMLDRVPPTP